MANVNGGLTQQNNQVQHKQPTPIDTIRGLLAQPKIKEKFENMLGKKSAGFMASIINVYSSGSLKDKDPMSVVSAAAIAATLDLPIDPNLGHAWIVPYGKKAQFQMATRGYVQLAQRSSQYKRINTVIVYENQFKSWNALTEELDADFTIDGTGNVVGYAAYFKLVNGFEKLVYWSKEKVTQHAKRYSKSFNNGPWQTNFDAMAEKTVLKVALKNWGVLSIEMQTAITADQAVIKDGILKGDDVSDSVEYPDNPESKDVVDVDFKEDNPAETKQDDFSGTPFEMTDDEKENKA